MHDSFDNEAIRGGNICHDATTILSNSFVGTYATLHVTDSGTRSRMSTTYTATDTSADIIVASIFDMRRCFFRNDLIVLVKKLQKYEHVADGFRDDDECGERRIIDKC